MDKISVCINRDGDPSTIKSNHFLSLRQIAIMTWQNPRAAFGVQGGKFSIAQPSAVLIFKESMWQVHILNMQFDLA